VGVQWQSGDPASIADWLPEDLVADAAMLQVLSFDAYLKFIEDVFLGGQRLDPATDTRPDPRPDVRENAPQLGNLLRDFRFTHPPHRPLVLPTSGAPDT